MSTHLLRHAVATVAYRGGKTLRGAPAEFSSFRPKDGSRSAGEILAHVCDLYDWALSLAEGAQKWKNTTPQKWDQDTARFFEALGKFDAALAARELPADLVQRLFQGPVADSLTHFGQIAMLRRLADAPVAAENYFVADIAAGRVGAAQTAPRKEFA